jgi:hypothetical protein
MKKCLVSKVGNSFLCQNVTKITMRDFCFNCFCIINTTKFVPYFDFSVYKFVKPTRGDVEITVRFIRNYFLA